MRYHALKSEDSEGVYKMTFNFRSKIVVFTYSWFTLYKTLDNKVFCQILQIERLIELHIFLYKQPGC